MFGWWWFRSLLSSFRRRGVVCVAFLSCCCCYHFRRFLRACVSSYRYRLTHYLPCDAVVPCVPDVPSFVRILRLLLLPVPVLELPGLVVVDRAPPEMGGHYFPASRSDRDLGGVSGCW